MANSSGEPTLRRSVDNDRAGSSGAMSQSNADRYAQDPTAKLVPEGIEGRVAAKGPLSDLVYQLVGGLRSGMGYCGATDIADLQKKARFLMDGNVAWESSLGDMLFGFLFDAIHHRGQLSSYLRPMGAKVPSIYGPSADDPGG